ncbi:hypothetical protein HDU98_007813 [Podochytrium sp. JEL0797]|nr:hypothetical protein HDU98_007813 [Podochytrium sp. JEL0797]
MLQRNSFPLISILLRISSTSACNPTTRTHPPQSPLQKRQSQFTLSPNYPLCDVTQCTPPTCLCPSFNPPGNLSLAETPQFILITFDDWVNAESYQNASQVFGHVNPNGCAIKTTFFTQIGATDPAYVTRLYAEGHEIADHTFSHPQWAQDPEIAAMISAATTYMGIPKNKIKGFRAPFLESTYTQLASAKANGLLWHSSTENRVEVTPWPYTLDHGIAYNCYTGINCTVPSPPIPGLWDLPMGEIYANSSETTTMSMDPWFGSIADTLAGLQYTFSVHHNNFKTPMGLWYHTWNSFGGDKATAVNQFISWTRVNYPDVWFVTASQLIEWMQNPYYCDGFDDNANGQVDEFVTSVCSYPGYTQFRTCYGCPTTLYTTNNPTPPIGCSPLNEFFVNQTSCPPLPLTKNTGTAPLTTPLNPTYPTIPNWTFQNCYLDNANTRTLASQVWNVSPFTISACVAKCAASGFTYAGAEFGSQCFCGSGLNSSALVVESSHCEDPCQGDSTQICGGSGYISVYALVGQANSSTSTFSKTKTTGITSTPPTTLTSLTTTIITASFITSTTTTTTTTSTSSITSTATSTSSHPSISGWTYSGCYLDPVNPRALSSQVWPTSSVTAQVCVAQCQAQGFAVAGMEYASQCFCGMSLPAYLSSACTMACQGDATQICGGPGSLTVYTSTLPAPLNPVIPGWTYTGCFTDSSSSRVLANEIWSIPASTMTVEACLSACKMGGYSFGGLEYAQQCFCGTSAPGAAAASAGCIMPCLGNATELCGGAGALTVYASSAPVAVNPVIPGWTYKGCFLDSSTSRTLPNAIWSIAANAMTVEACLSACTTGGYSFGGLEYAQQCFCGNSVPVTVASSCNMPCLGNATEICGGPGGLSVYLK